MRLIMLLLVKVVRIITMIDMMAENENKSGIKLRLSN